MPSSPSRDTVRALLAAGSHALLRYKLRTALSTIGVMLGVAAVISMTSVSAGAREEALRQIEALGIDNIIVRSRPFAPGESGVSAGLVVADGERLRHLVPEAAAVAPLVEQTAVATGPSRDKMLSIVGIGASYRDIVQLQISRGRFLSAVDAERLARVCVLGASVTRDLFGVANPIGESIRIDGVWYEVVGILADRTLDGSRTQALASRDLNLSVMVPLSTLFGHAIAADRWQRIDELWVRVSEGGSVDRTAAAVERTLARARLGRRDFEVIVPRELLAYRNRTHQTFAVVVGSVAALSLLVGGIGIMNVMLVSVIERTTEIGLRRAVGATQAHVAAQFLAETLMMTITGGIVGILLGSVLASGITAYAGWATNVSVSAIAIGFGVSVLVGLLAGSYPAARAARLTPIDALRHE